jgi:hypothetical protein
LGSTPGEIDAAFSHPAWIASSRAAGFIPLILRSILIDNLSEEARKGMQEKAEQGI